MLPGILPGLYNILLLSFPLEKQRLESENGQETRNPPLLKRFWSGLYFKVWGFFPGAFTVSLIMKQEVFFMQKQLTPGSLLDPEGRLAESGYSTRQIRTYNRKAVRACSIRIKEWDYYAVFNHDFGIALTIDDNSYMGLVSASFLDLASRSEKTVSPMFLLPFGKTGLPPSSSSGTSQKKLKNASFSFTHVPDGRRLQVRMDHFDSDTPFLCDILLSEEPQDSMVIATPFPKDPHAFYYNQKIIGMRASGTVQCFGKQWLFDPSCSFGLLDWGRGVWTYRNTWYWGAGMGEQDGHVIGFNLGYGFGDTSAASENMFFLDGIAHKLGNVTFEIPRHPDGADNFLSPWNISSDDGRFEGVFNPALDRASCTDLKLICSDQHQVFGILNAFVILDSGERLPISGMTCFFEKVFNKW